MKYLMGILSFLNLACSNKPTENDLLIKELDTSIIEMFNAHNIETSLDKNGIISINTKEKITIENNLIFQDYPDSYSSRLDMKIQLDDDRVIYESFGDIGKSKLIASQQNLLNFTKNDFHVILNAFNNSTDEQITTEEWTIGNSKYKVFIGNYGIKSSVEFNIPDKTFEKIEELVKNQDLKKNTHWVRFFYCNLNGEPFETEFLIDNELYANGITEMEKLDWEKSDKYYSLRNFMILRKIN
ncbi:DUF6348 family protein [Mangrovimonas sp. YM274]|uniref:DUF6348 family protein n=1 Tax=Mangrovimonas sp. YM274 TaxID=3070660 RepID=UPI0027DAF1B5|nr:DUF6348 family protein [Mangrovimonas sp. YM274]WMI68238.1 DUF6348 family protein [Mangrovimonas sp. YM274]